jgi:NAD(P)-dependent dehydrogenase (short-subunit alcohol dehydrogenase family)
MQLDLRGRRIVITGGTGGLGSAVVALFESAGAVCEVTTRGDGEVARPRVTFHAIDVTDEQAVTRFYAQFADLWASVHLVGAFTMAAVDQTSAGDFRKMFETNTVSCFLCCREAVKGIRRSGGAHGGRIVNVAARPALTPTGGMIAYSISKAGVVSMTQSLAEEVKPEGILVNAVAPSIMDTPLNRRMMPNADFSKWPKVEEVATAIGFLASPDNALTSGIVMPVYGTA